MEPEQFNALLKDLFANEEGLDHLRASSYKQILVNLNTAYPNYNILHNPVFIDTLKIINTKSKDKLMTKEKLPKRDALEADELIFMLDCLNESEDLEDIKYYTFLLLSIGFVMRPEEYNRLCFSGPQQNIEIRPWKEGLECIELDLKIMDTNILQGKKKPKIENNAGNVYHKHNY